MAASRATAKRSRSALVKFLPRTITREYNGAKSRSSARSLSRHARNSLRAMARSSSRCANCRLASAISSSIADNSFDRIRSATRSGIIRRTRGWRRTVRVARRYSRISARRQPWSVAQDRMTSTLRIASQANSSLEGHLRYIAALPAPALVATRSRLIAAKPVAAHSSNNALYNAMVSSGRMIAAPRGFRLATTSIPLRSIQNSSIVDGTVAFSPLGEKLIRRTFTAIRSARRGSSQVSPQRLSRAARARLFPLTRCAPTGSRGTVQVAGPDFEVCGSIGDAA